MLLSLAATGYTPTSLAETTVKAVGAGDKIFIGQFLKSGKYSEITSLKNFKDLKIMKIRQSILSGIYKGL